MLVGPAGSGKSAFARKHFRQTEILSSDFFRGLVSDDEDNQKASGAAFEVLYLTAEKRLAGRRLTAVDATNVRPDARRPLLAIARREGVPAVAVVFNLPLEVCLEWNRLRPGRIVDPSVISRQHEQLELSLPNLERQGFHLIYVFSTPEEIDRATVEREPARR